MAEILSTVSLVSFVLAGICLGLAVIFWFRFRIPTVIGDLSGRTARKSIAEMRERNEKSGGKSYRPSAVNVDRGKLTETMPGRTADVTEEIKAPPGEAGQPETGVLESNRVRHVESQPTELLDLEATAELVTDETELLVTTEKPMERIVGRKQMVLLEEVIFIHTQENIE